MLGPSQLTCTVQGDEPLIAEIRALTEEDLPIIPQPKQLALACNPAPVAARALPEASTAFRAGPSRPIFVGKSCRYPSVAQSSSFGGVIGMVQSIRAVLCAQELACISFSISRKSEAHDLPVQ